MFFDLDLAPDLLKIGGPSYLRSKIPEFFRGWKSGMAPWYFLLVWTTRGDVLRLWCENGGVTEQERTDELAREYFGATAPWSAAT